MKKFIFTILFSLFLIFPANANAQESFRDCTLSITPSSGLITPGEQLTFRVICDDPHNNVSYTIERTSNNALVAGPTSVTLTQRSDGKYATPELTFDTVTQDRFLITVSNGSDVYVFIPFEVRSEDTPPILPPPDRTYPCQAQVFPQSGHTPTTFTFVITCNRVVENLEYGFFLGYASSPQSTGQADVFNPVGTGFAALDPIIFAGITPGQYLFRPMNTGAAAEFYPVVFNVFGDISEVGPVQCGSVTIDGQGCPNECGPRVFGSGYMCGCGLLDETCCPDLNPLNLPSCDPSFGGQRMACVRQNPEDMGICAIIEPYLCADKKSIQSAIGCIPVDQINNFLRFMTQWSVGIAGGISLLMFLLGGFIVLTSSGNPDKLLGGKSLITSGIGGVVLLIFAIFLFRTIMTNIIGIPL